MKIIYLSFLLLFFYSFLSKATGQSLELEQYRWKNRLLVVFADSNTQRNYVMLNQEVEKQKEGFEDRDMVFIRLFENGQSAAGETPVSKEEAALIRKQFEIKMGDFRVFLIGKDGGVKRKGGAEIRAGDLYDLIDTMPMRQSEMRRKKKG